MASIAILGFGTIGSGVYEVVRENRDVLIKRTGEEICVKYILDLRDFLGEEIEPLVVHDASLIFQDEAVEVVVETMGGLTPAYEYVKRALLCGKSVVTSNKELVAAHGAELVALAKRQKKAFLFEASTGGAIPVIRPIVRSLSAEKILSVSGILNGTTNFILTKMEREDKEFDEALLEAQSLGYAEKNPTADVEGFDACRKIAILSAVSYGRHVEYEKIHTEGITKITKKDMAYAKAIGHTIKLIGKSIRTEKGVYAFVAPSLVSKEHPLSVVNDVYNGIFVVGNMLGDAMFYGKGAGKLPTASAVVGDVVEALLEKETPMPLCWEAEPLFLLPFAEMEARYLIRLCYKEIEKAKEKALSEFPSGRVVLLPEESGEFAIVTGSVTEQALLERAERLISMGVITNVEGKMRIEG